MATLIFIDDHPDSAESSATLARLMGHDAHWFTSAEHVIEEIVSLDPDVVFCDLNMPRVSGLTFARWMREEPTLRRAYLCALTAHSTRAYREAAREAGFDDFLTKPLDFGRIDEIVRTARERRRSAGRRYTSDRGADMSASAS